MTTDTHAPRGVALSPDQGTLYVVDRGDGAAVPATLRAYPVTDVGLGSSSILVAFGVAAGDDGPHGMCAAPDGRLAVAVGPVSDARGPGVEVFAPGGQLVQRLEVASGVPTNCAFGGPGQRTLFVTTSTGEVLQTADDDGGDH
jgi:gluconolactonase